MTPVDELSEEEKQAFVQTPDKTAGMGFGEPGVAPEPGYQPDRNRNDSKGPRPEIATEIGFEEELKPFTEPPKPEPALEAADASAPAQPAGELAASPDGGQEEVRRLLEELRAAIQELRDEMEDKHAEVLEACAKAGGVV